MDLIEKVKKKREFKGLPDGIIKRVIGEIDNDLTDEEKIKVVRRNLRKYFGVFLTNKVVKPKDLLDYSNVLKSHKSSQKREYKELYKRIYDFLGDEGVMSVIDFGCGVNGFSYPILRDYFGDVNYLGVEASVQIVNNTNLFFDKRGLGDLCKSVWGDVFDLNFVRDVLDGVEKKRVVFCFQVLDALEGFKKNFSRDFILLLKENSEFVVVSMPMKSLGGLNMKVKRKWIEDFLNENFEVRGRFELFEEVFFVLRC